MPSTFPTRIHKSFATISVGLILIVAASLVSQVIAQTVRQHGAHVHGEATLSVVEEGASLSITLEAPGMSIVGFEHAPGDDAQRKTLTDAITLLKSPATWLNPAANGGCALDNALVAPHGFGAEFERPGGEHLDDHDEKEAGQGDTQAHHEHADIDAQYRYTCHAPLSLHTLDVHLIERFPELHKLQVNLVLPDHQGSQVLVPGNTQVTLSP